MSDLKNAQRIYNNIHVLLGRGLFPGEGAEALHESQKFVAELIQQIEKDLSSEQPFPNQAIGLEEFVAAQEQDSDAMQKTKNLLEHFGLNGQRSSSAQQSKKDTAADGSNQQDGSGNWTEAGAGRVDPNSLPNKGRKGRRRKAD